MNFMKLMSKVKNFLKTITGDLELIVPNQFPTDGKGFWLSCLKSKEISILFILEETVKFCHSNNDDVVQLAKVKNYYNQCCSFTEKIRNEFETLSKKIEKYYIFFEKWDKLLICEQFRVASEFFQKSNSSFYINVGVEFKNFNNFKEGLNISNTKNEISSFLTNFEKIEKKLNGDLKILDNNLVKLMQDINKQKAKKVELKNLADKEKSRKIDRCTKDIAKLEENIKNLKNKRSEIILKNAEDRKKYLKKKKEFIEKLNKLKLIIRRLSSFFDTNNNDMKEKIDNIKRNFSKINISEANGSILHTSLINTVAALDEFIVCFQLSDSAADFKTKCGIYNKIISDYNEICKNNEIVNHSKESFKTFLEKNLIETKKIIKSKENLITSLKDFKTQNEDFFKNEIYGTLSDDAIKRINKIKKFIEDNNTSITAEACDTRNMRRITFAESLLIIGGLVERASKFLDNSIVISETEIDPTNNMKKTNGSLSKKISKVSINEDMLKIFKNIGVSLQRRILNKISSVKKKISKIF
ncbi:MAG: hypothetical protein RsTaC01_1070 [Candidatus Paraimprobicoccus trichonymphae]|uniref:Uncharacterized protein n=1 Tax=Candidatus Paraimprobicoccus trichonymphae TaxID=3033793 RepID=A0AA48I0K6_9FIRM|nr:MAG: hypothetical protein RsTaC01_1070 [Candidatus Paraimprobicoccus trichonymphae]